MALNAILKFETRLIKRKQNKTNPPNLAKVLGQHKGKERERNLLRSKKQSKPFSLLSHSLSRPTPHTHLRKLKSRPKKKISKKKGRNKQGERRREEEGGAFKPLLPPKASSNQVYHVHYCHSKVGVSKPRT